MNLESKIEKVVAESLEEMFDKVYDLVSGSDDADKHGENAMWKLFNSDGELVLEIEINDKSTEEKVVDFLMTVGLEEKMKRQHEPVEDDIDKDYFKFCDGICCGETCKFAEFCERYLGRMNDVSAANTIEKNTELIRTEECVGYGYKYFYGDPNEVIGGC